MARLKYWDGAAWQYLQDGNDGADGEDAHIIGRQLTSDNQITFVNTSTYHDLIPNSLPVMNVEAGAAYRLDVFVRGTNGATSTAKAMRFDGGTCTFTNIRYSSLSKNVAIGTSGTPTFQTADVATGVSLVPNASSTDWQIAITGLITINAAGTFMPKVAYVTADPTGTILIKAGTFVTLTKVPYFNV